VRFIDNFSTGSRGSKSVECFLEQEYAVVFMHRKGSIEPFAQLKELLSKGATHCTILQRTVTHCNTLQHAATRCNTLQHAATRCNTL